jgi:hypothetical protein
MADWDEFAAHFGDRFKPKYYLLDTDNHLVPATLMEWAMAFEHGNRTIGMTQITSEITVSTVFLGLDHRWFGNGPPLVFETMIFGGKLDQSQWRYSSFEDATVGHHAAVKKARRAAGQKITAGD